MTEQTPLGSGFGPKTTAEEAVRGQDLTGRTAIVTGGYSGLGLETTRVLAKAGAHVVVPARSSDKARTNLAGIEGIEITSLDLMEPASIDRFATSFVDSGRPLHMLIDSAGIMAVPLARDGRGYESQLSANHLGHFHLAARLWPALRRAAGARVVSVSSRGHRIADFDFNDPNFHAREYGKWLAYGQSKTANVLFAVALDQRGRQHNVRAFALHPGAILTDLARHLSDDEMGAFGVKRAANGSLDMKEFLSSADAKTVSEGAATAVWCATSQALNGKGGVYCEDCDIASVGPADGVRVRGVDPWAIDRVSADRLWSLSEELTGITFGM
jgi:NAD(P)-dependent dehydrogenase (short-subunit alcohol dehydrogenase family)